MKNRELTIVAIAAAIFFYLNYKNSAIKKKKKLIPKIIPQPLQNISEKEYYGTKSEFKAGEAQGSMNVSDILSNSLSAGIINVNSQLQNIPISREVYQAMNPNCKNCQ